MPRTGGMTPGISPVPGKRIGVLGGSFNPAHEGHRHISIMALQRLRLDAVWWMISPQNPLKDAGEMAPLHNRVRRARAVASHPDVHVTDIEAQLGTRFTADTVEALKLRFPAIRFVWLMGADNLCQIPKWRNWQRIFQAVPIAVFTRPSYSVRALSGRAAKRFAADRLSERRAASLAEARPPAWVFVHGRSHGQSASKIRAENAEWSAEGIEKEANAQV